MKQKTKETYWKFLTSYENDKTIFRVLKENFVTHFSFPTSTKKAHQVTNDQACSKLLQMLVRRDYIAKHTQYLPLLPIQSASTTLVLKTWVYLQSWKKGPKYRVQKNKVRTWKKTGFHTSEKKLALKKQGCCNHTFFNDLT